MSLQGLYALVASKANEIEAELKHLNRWSDAPLSPEKLENMGAFGSNTMTFEQWMQFVLIPRIHQIIKDEDSFPDGSMLAPYAIRYFDGDPEAGPLHDLLYELDNLINGNEATESDEMENTNLPESIVFGSMEIPPVVFTLIDVLPQFEGDDLESQLQTYDVFLSTLSPKVRPTISKLLAEAAVKTLNERSKFRILEAARSVANGGRAAAPYNHEEAMKRYREEHKKNFPS